MVHETIKKLDSQSETAEEGAKATCRYTKYYFNLSMSMRNYYGNGITQLVPDMT